MTEPQPAAPSPLPPRRPVLTLALALTVAAAVIASVVILKTHAPRPGAPAAQTTAPASSTAAPAKGDPAKPSKPGGKPAGALPALVAGSPLNDESFTQVSAEIVIGALGLKQNAQWQENVLAYMAKVLAKHKLSVQDYNDYARALYDHPDRARAVAENIRARVEKKVGYRIAMDKLPMFKFDEKAIKQMEKRLLR